MSARRPRPRPDTGEAILDAAERLFGLHGLQGVSLRQIGAAAGSANNYGVQYHFGDRARLVRAIFERRLPSLEVRRARLLAEARREGRLEDPRALLEVILRPLSAEVDSQGRRSYAAFLLGLLHHEGDAGPRLDADDLAPLTSHVTDRLQAALPHVPAALFPDRAFAAWTVFLSALVRWDRRRAQGETRVLPEALMLCDALDAAAAAIAAPVAPQVAAAGDAL